MPKVVGAPFLLFHIIGRWLVPIKSETKSVPTKVQETKHEHMIIHDSCHTLPESMVAKCVCSLRDPSDIHCCKELLSLSGFGT